MEDILMAFNTYYFLHLPIYHVLHLFFICHSHPPSHITLADLLIL